MTEHMLNYIGRSGDDGYGFWCPDCSRSVLVTLNPFVKTVLFQGEPVAHGARIGGMTMFAGPVYRGNPYLTEITDDDREFLSDAEIGW